MLYISCGWITQNLNGDDKMEDIFLKHQLAIAKSTLKMNDVGAMVMGGMSKDEARELLRKHGVKFHE
jgi:hypothetical protein